MEKGIHIFLVFIVIISPRLLCQMQAKSSGAEFLSTISKFMKRMNFVIACLRPSQNMTDKAFLQVVVQLTAKKCTKKCDAWQSFFLPCQAIAYSTFSSPPHLKLPRVCKFY